MDIGITYMADNKNKNGEVTESALDHIYIRKEMEPRMTVRKLEKSATDHLPIIAELRIRVEQQRTKTKIQLFVKEFKARYKFFIF